MATIGGGKRLALGILLDSLHRGVLIRSGGIYSLLGCGGLLIQQLLFDEPPGLDGTVYDESPGQGDDRPVQPMRMLGLDLAKQIHVPAVSGDISSVSAIDSTGAVQALTATFVTDHYEISAPSGMDVYNIRCWGSGASPTVDDKQSTETDADLFAWFSGQEGAGTSAYDMTGNGNHGTHSGAVTHGTLTAAETHDAAFQLLDKSGNQILDNSNTAVKAAA